MSTDAKSGSWRPLSASHFIAGTLEVDERFNELHAFVRYNDDAES